MPLPRVTMLDVARAAKVHQTTVSLALRNDDRLPEKTRARIRRIADRLGYRPDPLLAALNLYRSARLPPRAATTMAFLLNFRDRDELSAWHPHRLFLEGARRQAEQMGYRVEPFYVQPTLAGEGPRVERILRARGIVGVIIGAFGDDTIQFQMNWSQFSIVLIESQQLGVPLHMISNNQMMITRKAVRHLHTLGYRRIGLAVGRRGEVNLSNAFTAGYHAEVALRPDLARLPPLLLAGASSADIAPSLARWQRAHAFDVIASNWAQVPDGLRLAGYRVPGDVAVASLDLNPEGGSNAGMAQNHRVVGERAAEQLAILMRTYQRGVIEPHNSTFIEGRWVDGTDVPPAPPAGRRPRRPTPPARRAP
ncbi:MAG: LacI family DNA-binding transcriptional regulator [Verrucomicrobia bacterium]|nr:LacI family DNA-binding transcriptional regulator [Verrucomicrobiota bacterium]